MDSFEFLGRDVKGASYIPACAKLQSLNHLTREWTAGNLTEMVCQKVEPVQVSFTLELLSILLLWYKESRGRPLGGGECCHSLCCVHEQ